MAEKIGTALVIKGQVAAVGQQGNRPLENGSPVFQGDVVSSSKASAGSIEFLDKSVLNLGENSRVSLDQYAYNHDRGAGQALFKMAQGTFRTVTGEIVKSNPESFKMQSPLATIGIRGTETAHAIPPPGSGGGENHLVMVFDGKPVVVQPLGGGAFQVLSQSGVKVEVGQFGAGPVVIMTPQEYKYFQALTTTSLQQQGAPQDSVSTSPGQQVGQKDSIVKAASDAANKALAESAAKAQAAQTAKAAAEAAAKAAASAADAAKASQDGAAKAAAEAAAKAAADDAAKAAADAAKAQAEAAKAAADAAKAQAEVFSAQQAQVLADAVKAALDAKNGLDAGLKTTAAEPLTLSPGGIITLGAGEGTAGSTATIHAGGGTASAIVIVALDARPYVPEMSAPPPLPPPSQQQEQGPTPATVTELDLSGKTSAMHVDLAPGGDSSKAYYETLGNADPAQKTALPATITTVIASNHGDSITGNTAATTFHGGAGADTLTGRDGADVFVMGEHLTSADHIDGGAGSNTLRFTQVSQGGAEIHDLDNVTHVQKVVLGDADTSLTLAAGQVGSGNTLTIDGSRLTAAHSLTLVGSAETQGSLHVIGGAGADHLTGGGIASVITGGAGADTLVGGTGTDTFVFNAGDVAAGESITKASGQAILQVNGDNDFSLASISLPDISGVNHEIHLAPGVTLTLGPQAFADLTDSYVRFFGTASGTETLIFKGTAGDDVFRPQFDLPDSSINEVRIVGGGGNDTGDASGANGGTGLTFDNYNHTFTSDAPDAVPFTFTGTFNHFIGSENLNNVFVASSIAETFEGGGGSSVNTVDYSHSTAGVTVDLSAGTASSGYAAGDALIGIQNVVGSANADTLTGDANANAISGGGGSDVITGGGGVDTITPGTGSDSIVYTATSHFGDEVHGFLHGTDALHFYTIAGGGWLDDGLHFSTVAGASDNGLASLYYDAGTSTLMYDADGTGAGAAVAVAHLDNSPAIDSGDVVVHGATVGQTFVGTAAADTFIGGTGSDTVDYSGNTGSAITVNLQTGATSGGYAQGDTLVGIENYIGSVYPDFVTANNAGGTINLVGEGNGFVAGPGVDTVVAGSGRDYVSYAASTSGVTVDLGAGTGTGGYAQGDQYTGVETVIGSPYADTFIGGPTLENHFQGGGGDDVINGGGTESAHINFHMAADYRDATTGITATLAYNTGTDRNEGTTTGGGVGTDTLLDVKEIIGSNFDDTFTGGAGSQTFYGAGGNDTIDGGAGDDQVSYSRAASTVTVDLSTGIVSNDGDGGQDTLLNIEVVRGSGYDDHITGNDLGNVFRGGDGADTIVAGSGNDTFVYRDGEMAAGESIVKTAGTATLQINGDTDFTQATVTLPATGTHHMYLADGVTVTVGPNPQAEFGLTNSELLLHVDAGDTAHVVFQGTAGSDTFSWGHFVLEDMSATSSLHFNGAGGADTLDLSDSTIGMTIDNVTRALTGGGFSGPGSATFTSDFAHFITGSGDDTFIASSAAESFDGGTGSNTVDYSHSTSGVQVSLSTNTTASGFAAGDTLSNIQNIIGSAFDDDLFGQTTGSVLSGGAGNDVIQATGGDNTLTGGAGADTLIGGAGTDTFVFNAGDVASGESITKTTGSAILMMNGDNDLSLANISLTNLSGVNHEIHLASGITLTFGSQPFVGMTDSYVRVYGTVGGAETVVLNGTAGNDVFQAWLDFPDSSIDEMRFVGGGGNDTADFTGGHGGTVFIFDNVSHVMTGNDPNAVPIVLSGNFNHFLGSEYVDNVFVASNLAETFEGGGGSSVNTVDYSHSTAGVTVDLSAGTASSGYAAGDALIGIQNVVGSANADTLTAKASGSTLDGGAGADTLIGGAGSDTYVFHTGDVASGESVTDHAGTNTFQIIGNVDLSQAGVSIDLSGSAQLNLSLGANATLTFALGFGQGLDKTYDGTVAGEETIITKGTTGNDVFDFQHDVNGTAPVGPGWTALDHFRLAGNGGSDTLDFSGSTTPMTFNVPAGTLSFTQSSATWSFEYTSDFQTFIGSSANDSFLLGSLMSSAISIDGSAGADSLTFTQHSQTGAEIHDLDNVRGIETIAFGETDTDITTTDSVVDTGQSLYVDVSSWLGSSSFTFNGGAETDGSFSFAPGAGGTFTITGGNGNDTFLATGGTGTFNGGAGNDTFNGSSGHGTFTGGAGSDTFLYTAPTAGVGVATNITPTAAGASGDYITDFQSGTDAVNISSSAFGGISATITEGTNFATIAGEYNGTNAAGTATSYDAKAPTLIMDGQHHLIYDANGSDPGYTVLATTSAGHDVAASDVHVGA